MLFSDHKDSPSILLVFATKLEAKPLLDTVSHKRICSKPFLAKLSLLFKGNDVFCLISGVGTKKTKQSLEYLFDHQYYPKHMINIGLSGSLHSAIPLGTLFECDNVRYADLSKGIDLSAPLTLSSFPHDKNISKASLISVNKSIEGEDKKQKLSPLADIVDMEGFAMATICQKQTIPCTIFKITSDHCDQNTKKDFLSSVTNFSKKLSFFSEFL